MTTPKKTSKKTRKRSRHNGEGSIRKRADGTWEGRYTLGQDANTGKQVRKSVYGKTRAEVAEKLKQKLSQTEKGAQVLANTGNLTLADYLLAHLETRKTEVGSGTFLKLQSFLRIVRLDAIGGMPLNNLKPVHLEAFYRLLAAKYSAQTVRHIATLLKRALRQAVRHEVINRNPADIAELPRLTEQRAGIMLEPEQLAAILQSAQKVRLYPLFAIIAALGLRHGEALGLQWGDIDLDANTLDVARAVVSHGGKPLETAPKTSSSYRTLYLSAEVSQLLIQWQNTLKMEDLPVTSSSWVFPNKKGGMLSQHNVRRIWRGILADADAPPARIHDLRSAFLSRLIETGADPRTAADLAGHSDPRMTLRVYAYSRAERRKEALLASSVNILPALNTPIDTPTETEHDSITDKQKGENSE